jgi:restriction system protein
MGERIEVDFEFECSTKKTGKYLVFDTETTGLPFNYRARTDDFQNWPYVVQIAWLLFDDDRKLIEAHNFYLKQQVKIPADATRIHGITTAMMLEKGVEPSNVYADFKKAIDNTEYLIAHNIDFDVPIVHCEFLRNGIPWRFHKDRMLCTMKTATSFCKIPRYSNGEYKWPKLTELYQKCFFPGHSITIFPDSASTSNLHSAKIDAAITAQCFFKLIDFGYFKGLKTRKTGNSLSGEPNEDNFDELHGVYEYEEYTRNDDIRYVAEIRHLGLDTSRVIKDEYESGRDDKVEAQFKKWDDKWAKISQKRKLMEEAEERTRDAQEEQKVIEDLHVYALNVDATVNWDSLKNTKNFEVPNPKNNLEAELNKISPPQQPTYNDLPKEPDKGTFEPKRSVLDNILKQRKERKTRQAETLYKEAMTAWKKSVDEINFLNSTIKEKYEQRLRNFELQKQEVNNRFDVLEKNWAREKKAYAENQEKYNKTIDDLKKNYLDKNELAVKKYCEIVINKLIYPKHFPKKAAVNYSPKNKVLVVDYLLPALDDFPRLVGVKYIASRNELKESFLSKTALSKIYDPAIYKITLRTLNELFKSDKAEALESIIFNGWVNTIDKATGKKVKNCIVSIKSNKIEFNAIKFSNVDPKICFKDLNGIGSRKLSSMTAVEPIAQIASPVVKRCGL